MVPLIINVDLIIQGIQVTKFCVISYMYCTGDETEQRGKLAQVPTQSK